MYTLLKKALFTLPAETAHHLSLQGIQLLYKTGILDEAPKVNTPSTTVMGITFPNPVGLAAGLDKNGDYINALSALDFGFIEIGTVTPRPQPGNPKPRLFRLVKEQAIINRMGFNNKGIDHLVEQVKRSQFKGVLGINIGKNKDTPAEKAVDDYVHCMRKVYPLASYITINLSSPNTPGLRDLQFGDTLNNLLRTLKEEQKTLTYTHGKYIPIAVKIAPDMAEEDIVKVAGTLKANHIDGVIATNTTINKESVAGHSFANEQGGLSGAPLTNQSTHVIKLLADALGGEIPIIGVGGILSAENAQAKLNAGASLVQIYSGFIYKGPKLIRDICRGL